MYFWCRNSAVDDGIINNTHISFKTAVAKSKLLNSWVNETTRSEFCFQINIVTLPLIIKSQFYENYNICIMQINCMKYLCK